MPGREEVPEEAVEAAKRSIEADREFAMREGGVGIDARMQGGNAAEAAAPAIRNQERQRLKEALEQVPETNWFGFIKRNDALAVLDTPEADRG